MWQENLYTEPRRLRTVARNQKSLNIEPNASFVTNVGTHIWVPTHSYTLVPTHNRTLAHTSDTQANIYNIYNTQPVHLESAFDRDLDT